MSFGEQDICQLVESTWGTVLGLEVEPSTEANSPEGTETFLTGCIRISGAWDGAVTLDCSTVLAGRAAAIMFGVEPREATDEQIRDALGELTNIVGGNFKALLPSPCYLSLPIVAEGADRPLADRDDRAQTWVRFQCQGQSFQVSVLEPDAARAQTQASLALGAVQRRGE